MKREADNTNFYATEDDVAMVLLTKLQQRDIQIKRLEMKVKFLISCLEDFVNGLADNLTASGHDQESKQTRDVLARIKTDISAI